MKNIPLRFVDDCCTALEDAQDILFEGGTIKEATQRIKQSNVSGYFLHRVEDRDLALAKLNEGVDILLARLNNEVKEDTQAVEVAQPTQVEVQQPQDPIMMALAQIMQSQADTAKRLDKLEQA